MSKPSIKAVLFDVDGVIIAGRGRLFSDQLAEKQRIPVAEVNAFFRAEFDTCVLGQADLRDVILPYLAKWRWQGSVDELLAYWFVSERETNLEVLDIVRQMRERGVRCCMATRQEKHRMRYLADEVGLCAHFDGAFVTCEMGIDKSAPNFYAHVIEALRLPPEEVAFFDDTLKNVDAARSAGLRAYLFDHVGVLREFFASTMD